MSASEVNEHYLGHVVELSANTEVEASEDIMSTNGMKLLAKGAKIDERARERLLRHRLTKPLEQLMRVVDGVGSRKIDHVAESLLERHPLLTRVCGETSARLLVTAFRHMSLSPQVDSLLSVYAGQAPGKLEHAVGIALLSAAMARDMPNCDTEVLMLAGLLHDVGELYIDPAFLQPGVKLNPQQWKHIATHPIVGSHVLTGMQGAGMPVAKVVMQHHERLDGFGYPRGQRGADLSLSGQILAVSEMLMGLMESGANHAERANIAMKLVPGEFNRELLGRVVAASRIAAEDTPPNPQTPDIEDMGRRMSTLAGTLQRFQDNRDSIQAQSTKPNAHPLLGEALQRAERVRSAFTSTGLGFHTADALSAELRGMDGQVLLEVSIVLRELQWRMAELERQLTIRSEQLSAGDAQHVKRFIELIRA